MIADLHIHTTYSDGIYTPSLIVKKSQQKGLKVISITDHDTVDGIEESINEAKNNKIEVIPGIEVSCEYKGKEVHILGYYLDYKDKNLLSILKDLQESREKRVSNIIDKIAELGYYITKERVKKYSEGSSIGRVHIAQALVDSGYIMNVQQAFDTLLGYDCPGYVSRKKLTPKETINLILSAKGIPVLAHPCFLPNINFIEDIIKQGILGIEVYYPSHDIEMIKKLKILAKTYNLIITGGSDFHGEYRGALLGQTGVNEKEVEKLKQVSDEIFNV